MGCIVLVIVYIMLLKMEIHLMFRDFQRPWIWSCILLYTESFVCCWNLSARTLCYSCNALEFWQLLSTGVFAHIFLAYITYRIDGEKSWHELEICIFVFGQIQWCMQRRTHNLWRYMFGSLLNWGTPFISWRFLDSSMSTSIWPFDMPIWNHLTQYSCHSLCLFYGHSAICYFPTYFNQISKSRTVLLDLL